MRVADPRFRYGSVCSGIEATTVAWHPLGWEPAWFSEVDCFASAVLAHHYSDVQNLGDMTKFKEWPNEIGAVDLIVGGTPCQSFSVAGKRGGLDDARGNLTLVYLSLLERFRPRWMVWENVPGVLSSDGGRTFGAVLGGLAKLGYGFAYRILDAQYFGVPQRRRRVYIVGYLGDWRRAAAVLFERESLSWNPPPRREAWEGVTGTSAARITGGGGLGTDFGRSGGLIGTVSSKWAKGTGGPSGDECQNLVVHTLRGEGCDASEDGSGRGAPLVIAPTLSRSGAGDRPNDMASMLQVGHAVRRITPREAERLQGFPGDYTLVPYKNKLAADTPRYRAIGNSMAVPVMRWIGERIKMMEKQNDLHYIK